MNNCRHTQSDKSEVAFCVFHCYVNVMMLVILLLTVADSEDKKRRVNSCQLVWEVRNSVFSLCCCAESWLHCSVIFNSILI